MSEHSFTTTVTIPQSHRLYCFYSLPLLDSHGARGTLARGSQEQALRLPTTGSRRYLDHWKHEHTCSAFGFIYLFICLYFIWSLLWVFGNGSLYLTKRLGDFGQRMKRVQRDGGVC